jgi:DNA polymerase
MSDQPTDIVFSALQQIQANGVRLRASLDTCERLRSTASATQPQSVAPSRDPAPASQKIAPSAKVEDSPGTLHAATPAMTERPRTQPAPAFSTRDSAPRGTSEKAAKLDALRGPVLACTKCPHLVQSRTQVVFGVGNPDAEVMFVGEAPGADEDLVGEPFVGRAGQLLTKIIEAMNFHRADVYIANILKCRPNTPPGESGNRKPTPAEMNVCKPYLLQQIEIIQPKVLVALGATAVEGLLGMEKAGITRLRGTWKEFHGIPLMPTFHPSFLLRPSGEQTSNKRLVWEDMLAVLERLGHEITAKQRGYFLSK